MREHLGARLGAVVLQADVAELRLEEPLEAAVGGAQQLVAVCRGDELAIEARCSLAEVSAASKSASTCTASLSSRSANEKPRRSSAESVAAPGLVFMRRIRSRTMFAAMRNSQV